MIKNKKFVLAAAVLFALVGLSACGQSNSSESSSSDSITRQLTDAQDHKVEIPEKPKRVIASYLEDYLVALDEKPVAQWTVGKGSIQDYLQDDLKDIPTINYDLPYEEVLKYEPDLLLIGSNATVEGGKYDEYAKIAPTYVVKNGDGVTWKEQLNEIGKVFDKEEQAKKVEENYETLIAETKKELGGKIEGKSAAVLWVTNNSAFMVAENRSSGRLLYDDLGFEVPALTKEVSEKASSDWSPVSLESLSQLDADYLFLVNSDQGAAMFEDPLWQNIPAVKHKQLYEFGPETSWLYNGPIAYTKMVENIKEVLK
ncbi:ABC transporter substrate-binding protein [Enterococcus pallens]|uniref:ABC transporter periplasmic substrate-binding protein n=1 Tax=Enterococcus pallens ATCC BAA-351 TaxID=1158607 RepID=R2SHQ1_9ENTE|nr:ABC transporter substrate-binding protein [Enterococcus pallens]EOH87714.1 ABC transporter periplasmic substrate-binding protein [Enterococcus pallens ATCC BAA-351]EOU17928.1 ABC transporter periplasmic substrate-binding protein [Enterococcus pallens ATCC BAA-351]OJG82449.1 ABC transporter periplasmic substrate-binding protein [Enterococcus pallens]